MVRVGDGGTLVRVDDGMGGIVGDTKTVGEGTAVTVGAPARLVGDGIGVTVGKDVGTGLPFMTSGRYTTLFIWAETGKDNSPTLRSAARAKQNVR